jgi:uncharacterized protein YcbX
VTPVQILELWRYPVKSMQGERLEEAAVGPAGVVGDRQFALIDTATGMALTARRSPELLFCSARLVDADTVVVDLPDGTVGETDDQLSSWIGRDVTLQRAGSPGTFEIAVDFEDEAGSEWIRWQGPEWSFHDSTKRHVSILGTGSIGGWDRRRFRGNVIVEAPAQAEDALVGHRVSAGTAGVDVVKRIDRCVMVTRPQPGGIERDLDVLRTINADLGTCLGVGGLVAVPGRVAVGDVVTVEV